LRAERRLHDTDLSSIIGPCRGARQTLERFKFACTFEKSVNQFFEKIEFDYDDEHAHEHEKERRIAVHAKLNRSGGALRAINACVRVCITFFVCVPAFAGPASTPVEPNAGPHTPDPEGAGPQPRYPAPVQFQDPGETDAVPSLQLLGIDLAQGPNSIRDAKPELDGQLPLLVTAYWLPMVRLESSVPANVTIWDHLGLMTQEQSFRAGPKTGERPWDIGSVYRVEYTVNTEEAASQFSGEASLSITLQTTTAKSRPPLPLQLLGIKIRPIVRQVPLSGHAVQEAFPSGAHALGVYVRMGYGSEAHFDAPVDWPERIRRIAIISSLSFRAVPQGKTVGYVIFDEGTENARKLPIVSGTMTSRCDYDLFERDRLDHDRAPIFESRDSAMLDARGRPARLHTYFGIQDLPPPVSRVRTITLVCESDVVLDIIGLVALTD
jgi:hypothetical protein